MENIKDSIKIFEEKNVRTHWDEEQGNEAVTNCHGLKLMLNLALNPFLDKIQKTIEANY